VAGHGGAGSTVHRTPAVGRAVNLAVEKQGAQAVFVEGSWAPGGGSGLNLRTIQRLESAAGGFTDSLRALAAVLVVAARSLPVGNRRPSQQPLHAMLTHAWANHG